MLRQRNEEPRGMLGKIGKFPSKNLTLPNKAPTQVRESRVYVGIGPFIRALVYDVKTLEFRQSTRNVALPATGLIHRGRMQRNP